MCFLHSILKFYLLIAMELRVPVRKSNINSTMIQEHWLYPDELTYMSFLSEYFCSFSTSSMTIDDKLLRGRPHGGVSILWRKSLSHIVKTVKYDDDRVIGIELQLIHYCFYVATCHMNVTCFMMIIVFI